MRPPISADFPPLGTEAPAPIPDDIMIIGEEPQPHQASARVPEPEPEPVPAPAPAPVRMQAAVDDDEMTAFFMQ